MSDEPLRWSLATRIVFRFCFLYFSLYIVFTQMLGSLVRRPLPESGLLTPMRSLVA